MSTPLVISVTDELVAELEYVAKRATKGEWWIDSHGHTMVSHDSGVTHTVFQAMDIVKPAVRHPETGNLSHWPNDWDASFIATANPATILALLAERAELLRDAERLDWFIKECCVMECMNGSAWPVIYRIYWSHEAEGQREWHASPRAAIDAAMQPEAKP